MKKLSGRFLVQLHKHGLFPQHLIDGWVNYTMDEQKIDQTKVPADKFGPFKDKFIADFVLTLLTVAAVAFGILLFLKVKNFGVWSWGMFLTCIVLAVLKHILYVYWNEFAKDFNALTEHYPRGLPGIIMDDPGTAKVNFEKRISELAAEVSATEARFGSASLAKELSDARTKLRKTNASAARFGIIDGDLAKAFDTSAVPIHEMTKS